MGVATATSPSSPHAIACDWLDRFSTALGEPDEEYPDHKHALARLFSSDAYLRDHLLLSWDLRTLHGIDNIVAYFLAGVAPDSGAIAAGGLSKVVLDERDDLVPELLVSIEQPGAIQLSWIFESTHARARGSARLVPPASDAPADLWRARSVFFMLDAIKGHKERSFELGLYGEGGVRIPWEQVNREQQEKVERDPHVVIVGAGQTGVQVAARLQQLGVPTLIIERNARVGDTWRQRYDTLTLHTPRHHHSLLYFQFPQTWPMLSPKQKVADWLEIYSGTQNLVVWTDTTVTSESAPTYDSVAGRWSLSVMRNGERVTLRPAHVVLATGTLGPPNMPSIPHQDLFSGKVLHSSFFKNGVPFAGQRVLVVGSANTGADVCGDLVGAKANVTLLQRSPTSVVLPDALHAFFHLCHPANLTADVADFKWLSVPHKLREQLMLDMGAAMLAAGLDPDCASEEDARRKAGMVARGFLFGSGPDGRGILGQFNECFSGYLMDAGFSDLVLGDNITIKSGSGIARFTANGVELEDGTALELDAVIFATGYRDARENWKALFGDEVIERAGPAWGLDAEGEQYGQYRPTGHPGLWYGGGGFDFSRWGSKPLGLLIQADHLGLWKR